MGEEFSTENPKSEAAGDAFCLKKCVIYNYDLAGRKCVSCVISITRWFACGFGTPKCRQSMRQNSKNQQRNSKFVLTQNLSVADDYFHIRQTIHHLCRPIIIFCDCLSLREDDYHPIWMILKLNE
jgi:hypothetical protein